MEETSPDGTDEPVIAPKNLEEFLDFFVKNHREDNFIVVKYGNYDVKEDEIIAEAADWTSQYLQYMSCPSNLEADITRQVLDETKRQYLNPKSMSTQNVDQIDGDASNGLRNHDKSGFESMQLLQNVTSTINKVCQKLKKDDYTTPEERKGAVAQGRVIPTAVAAVKNGRRKMEDRHVVLHDVNAVYSSQIPKLADEPPISFYGVYDGHAGKDAAAYAASHVHFNILNSEHFPSDPVQAIREGFLKTDASFLDKSEKESLKSGTTAVCSMIRGNTLYAAWLGDSQAILVRKGKPVNIIVPHKPNRPDEKKRIEDLGGMVIYWGTWRVCGQLAVSRAIGDASYKPYVSAEPDVTTVEMDGSEDFMIVACDGLWDTVDPETAIDFVFSSLQDNPEDLAKVGNDLVTLAKEKGSRDNITIIVVFLKPVNELVARDYKAESLAATDVNQGISSTSEFISDPSALAEMNALSDREPPPSDPFSPMVENGSGGGHKEKSAFDSPMGGNVFGDSPNPFASAAESSIGDGAIQSDFGENMDQFKRASPSMFEQSMSSPALDEEEHARARGGASGGSSENVNTSSSDQPDFMANQQVAWINGKPVDSGFISPASASRHSDPDEAGRHEARPDVDDELEESREVTELLAKVSGGQLPKEMMEFHKKISTPEDVSSSEEEDGDNTSLEDILAAARNNPDQVADSASVEDEDEDEDDDSSSSEDEPGLSSIPPQVQAPEPPTQIADSSDHEQHLQDLGIVSISKKEAEEESSTKQSVDDEISSSSEETGEGFTFVKPHEDLVNPEQVPAEFEPLDTSNTNTSASLLDDDPQDEMTNEKVVPAVSTLNAVDSMNSETAVSSGPSSMGSQAAAETVIVASQEVPAPDQASFIITDDIIASSKPQEAVRELIGQSPIPEEFEKDKSAEPEVAPNDHEVEEAQVEVQPDIEEKGDSGVDLLGMETPAPTQHSESVDLLSNESNNQDDFVLKTPQDSPAVVDDLLQPQASDSVPNNGEDILENQGSEKSNDQDEPEDEPSPTEQEAEVENQVIPEQNISVEITTTHVEEVVLPADSEPDLVAETPEKLDAPMINIIPASPLSMALSPADKAIDDSEDDFNKSFEVNEKPSTQEESREMESPLVEQVQEVSEVENENEVENKAEETLESPDIETSKEESVLEEVEASKETETEAVSPPVVEEEIKASQVADNKEEVKKVAAKPGDKKVTGPAAMKPKTGLASKTAAPRAAMGARPTTAGRAPAGTTASSRVGATRQGPAPTAGARARPASATAASSLASRRPVASASAAADKKPIAARTVGARPASATTTATSRVTKAPTTASTRTAARPSAPTTRTAASADKKPITARNPVSSVAARPAPRTTAARPTSATANGATGVASRTAAARKPLTNGVSRPAATATRTTRPTTTKPATTTTSRPLTTRPVAARATTTSTTRTTATRPTAASTTSSRTAPRPGTTTATRTSTLRSTAASKTGPAATSGVRKPMSVPPSPRKPGLVSAKSASKPASPVKKVEDKPAKEPQVVNGDAEQPLADIPNGADEPQVIEEQSASADPVEVSEAPPAYTESAL